MDCKHEPADWYDKNVPADHHHPGEPWIVDRCADRCDDQLPLFSRVGRGLQGDGYFVRVHHDSDNETILEGLTYDPHTGAYTHDWFSDNINGGILSYKYKFYPYTDPKTFTITFKLDRPGYDPAYPDEEPPDGQRGWEWTTPAIPWVWDDEATHMLGGVGTLFLKKTGAPTWQNVDISGTPNSIAEAAQMVEKLIYPEDTERAEYHAPAPGDPWTVNLTYGIGGDIDCPTTDEFKDHLHKDLYDNKYDSIPGELKPLNGDGGNASVWDWILYARDYIVFEEGFGIDITETNPDNNGKRKVNIAANLEQGPGIKITDHNGAAKIEANLEAGDGVSITDSNGKKKISADPSHLHKDLYGAGTNNDHTTEIQNLNLLPLNGDQDGVANVWDWIKYAINSAIQPVLNPSIYKTTLGEQGDTHWLVSFKPTVSPSRAITTSQITNWIAAIPVVIEVEYFDVLPTVYVNMTTKTTGGIIRSGNSIYGGTDNIRLGTGEIAVVCTKSGSGSSSVFTPVNLKNLTLFPSRPDGYQKMKYPPVNPEALVNGGFGQIAQGSNLVSDSQNNTWSLSDYPGETFSVIDLVTQHYFDNTNATLAAMGAWAVYAGIGNVKSSNNLDSRVGGFPWVREDSTTGGTDFFAYIFNRSTGNVGVRVRIDNGRTYSLSFSQAVTVENN